MKIVAEFNEQAGIQQLEDAANSKITDPALNVRYSLFARHCMGPNAVEAVRAHLDSGVLAKLAAKQVSVYFNPIKVTDWTNHGYTCVLLAALAMNLGCRAYSELKGYHIMIYNTYNEFL
ncbi:hypothetical protein Slin15195_G058450 [Septoria linicola]|uniref:Uncharacterized protein n=1 Tax=Septoria linicola TaxID=215465 RepID=A0A9Q9AXN1_9PEZI|nr:hypothetical protein Slin15195_G058450 [Septoria linicola]